MLDIKIEINIATLFLNGYIQWMYVYIENMAHHLQFHAFHQMVNET